MVPGNCGPPEQAKYPGLFYLVRTSPVLAVPSQEAQARREVQLHLRAQPLTKLACIAAASPYSTPFCAHRTKVARHCAQHKLQAMCSSEAQAAQVLRRHVDCIVLQHAAHVPALRPDPGVLQGLSSRYARVVVAVQHSADQVLGVR